MFVVFTAALIVRIAASTFLPNGTDCTGCHVGLAIQGSSGIFRAPQSRQNVGGDGAFYVLAAHALADGRGLVDPFAAGNTPYAQQPPLWTLVLGIVELMTFKTIFAKKLLFSVLGSVTAVLVGIAGRQIATPRTGIMAGAIAAVYPGFWLYERNLNAETIVFPLIAVVLILAYRYRERPTWGLVLALGAAVGVLILSRSEQVLIIPLLLVPLVLSTRTVAWRSRILRLVAAGAIIVLAQAPWTIYNLGRFDHPVILSTDFGYTAQAGACPSTFSGPRLGSFDSLHCVFVALPAKDRLKDASVTDGLYRERAFTYTRQHLGRLPVVTAAREARTWSLVPPGLQISFNQQLLDAPSFVLWLQLLAYWALLVLSIAGAVRLRGRRMRYALFAFPITVVVSTAITFGDSRYRAPAEVTLTILAACALDGLTKRRRLATPERSRGEVQLDRRDQEQLDDERQVVLG